MNRLLRTLKKRKAQRQAGLTLVELLIAKGADLNAKDMSGDTPLNVATIMREQEIAELLRKNGAKE